MRSVKFSMSNLQLIVLALVTFVTAPMVAWSAEPITEGNGTLPAKWHGFVVGDFGVPQLAVRMGIQTVASDAYMPTDLGCIGQLEDASGYVAAGWLQIGQGALSTIYRVSAVCLNREASAVEIVALDASKNAVHLQGSLSNKKFGMMSSGTDENGLWFFLMEDRS